MVRPSVKLQQIQDIHWLAGFVSAEGCFSVSIKRSKVSIGFQVFLRFIITQHARDEQIMRSLVKYLDCGNIYKNGNAFDFRVTKTDDIVNKIIPFFKEYPILGVKAFDFAD